MASYRVRCCSMSNRQRRIDTLITGQDGIRYALRPNQVAVIHDADECRDETVLRIYGGNIVRVPCSLEEVVGWLGR
jgi:hypothetical protein